MAKPDLRSRALFSFLMMGLSLTSFHLLSLSLGQCGSGCYLGSFVLYQNETLFRYPILRIWRVLFGALVATGCAVNDNGVFHEVHPLGFPSPTRLFRGKFCFSFLLSHFILPHPTQALAFHLSALRRTRVVAVGVRWPRRGPWMGLRRSRALHSKLWPLRKRVRSKKGWLCQHSKVFIAFSPLAGGS